MQQRTVLISGAGIAGPALAFWLRRYGFRPTIVERVAALRDSGYKVDLRGAALDVVAQMGLLDVIRRASTDMQRTTFVDGAGKPIATMDAELFGGRSNGDVEVMRGELIRILQDVTSDDVEYLFGDTIAAIAEDSRGVRVDFQRAAPRTFDLLIGADGLHSNVRKLVFGPESRFVHSLGHQIAVFTVPNIWGLDRQELLYALPGKTVNVYSTRHSADAKAAFLHAQPTMDSDVRDVARQKANLAEMFAGAKWDVPRLLDAMVTAPDFYCDIISQVRMERWSNGRIALLGDAAFGPSPASGQGTSLALVGAYVLAGELACDIDHQAAFACYERAMHAFVARNQQLAQGNLKGMVLGSRAQIWFQTRFLQLLPHLPGKERIIGRVAGAIHDAATAITLQDYSQVADPASSAQSVSSAEV